MRISPSFFPRRTALMTALSLAALMAAPLYAQAPAAAPAAAQQAPAADAPPAASATMSATGGKQTKGRKSKDEKVVKSKDSIADAKKTKKAELAAGLDAKLPDKTLYDKAVDSVKHGRFDVARLELQTLLNTYPDSEYLMRSKLAIADSWYKEGGSAALTQAEQEYKDFITFFPNAPEAAEAQMRVGDIYFRQMDKPDRDYSKAVHAEEEYRLMLTQFPDSPLVPEAKQRLREVQESLATREASIGDYYSSRETYAAAIARFQTVVDTYPQYSHMDEVLIGLGDAYAAQTKYVRSLAFQEGPKAKLVAIYDADAANAYRKVILEHSASPHVEDARDRLAAMNLPIPVPTPEQVAASEALENSRQQYNLTNRAALLILRKPDVVQAARMGEPTLADPKPTYAPAVTQQFLKDFAGAFDPNNKMPVNNLVTGGGASTANGAATPAPAAAVAPAAAGTAPAQAGGGALQLQEIPAAGSGTPNSSTDLTPAPSSMSPSSGGGNGIGIEVVQPSAGNAAPAGAAPAAGTAKPSDYGLKVAGPADATPLPAVEKPADAPTQVNDIKPGSQPAAQKPPANGKAVKPDFSKDDESSSKHKKKKGLSKLIPH